MPVNKKCLILNAQIEQHQPLIWAKIKDNPKVYIGAAIRTVWEFTGEMYRTGELDKFASQIAYSVYKWWQAPDWRLRKPGEEKQQKTARVYFNYTAALLEDVARDLSGPNQNLYRRLKKAITRAKETFEALDFGPHKRTRVNSPSSAENAPEENTGITLRPDSANITRSVQTNVVSDPGRVVSTAIPGRSPVYRTRHIMADGSEIRHEYWPEGMPLENVESQSKLI